MADLLSLTLAEARDALKAGETSAVDLVGAHVGAMERARPLNLFITETAEQALAMAEAADARRAKGEAGPLNGLPIGVKDLFCTEGVLTTAASHILDGFVPTYESTVTANLWRDGAVMLGKLNLDEFAMGSSTLTSYYGPTINPWSPRDGGGTGDGFARKLVPGGSSGGSGAAIAAGVGVGALGTDTGGS
ncbi:MAG: Asp-tRNA(Asn)/Glu-tRNA(Gln) amidotransferase subunit GatA, partial [Rhodospirillaceae bacterium]|nr:Asp-tRNA(Asn)/Glu-tRNA(Gln) amidotransferase subunit GatA [Rhodospirillaceae bacterium]